jgi:hypothetical protein
MLGASDGVGAVGEWTSSVAVVSRLSTLNDLNELA